MKLARKLVIILLTNSRNALKCSHASVGCEPSSRPSVHQSVYLVSVFFHSVILSIWLSVHPSVCLSVHPSVLPPVCLSYHMSIHPFISLSNHQSDCRSIRPAVCLVSVFFHSVILSVRWPVHMIVCPSICLFVRPSICPSNCPSVHPSVLLPVCLSSRMSIHPFISLSNHQSDCHSIRPAVYMVFIKVYYCSHG